MKRDTFLCSILMIVGGTGLAGIALMSGLNWIYETYGLAATRLTITSTLAIIFGAGLGCRLIKWGR